MQAHVPCAFNLNGLQSNRCPTTKVLKKDTLGPILGIVREQIGGRSRYARELVFSNCTKVTRQRKKRTERDHISTFTDHNNSYVKWPKVRNFCIFRANRTRPKSLV
jgi:hypothetical protein